MLTFGLADSAYDSVFTDFLCQPYARSTADLTEKDALHRGAGQYKTRQALFRQTGRQVMTTPERSLLLVHLLFIDKQINTGMAVHDTLES